MLTTKLTPDGPQDLNSLYLGRVGETLARQICFDCAGYVADYGSGVAELVAMTPEGTKYAPANVSQSGSAVTWTISEADVGTAGRGRAELSWLVDGTVAKSRVYTTIIRSSLTGTGSEEAPDVYKDWVDKITRVGTQAGIDAQSAAASAEAAADSSEGAAGSAAGAGESAAEAEESAQSAEDAAGMATEQANRAKALVDGAVDTIQQATAEGVTEVEASGDAQSQRLATQGAAIVTEATAQANRATEQAGRAMTQADAAAGSATEAGQSAEAAQQAQEAAEEAQGKAETAATAAGESAAVAGEAVLGAYVCKTAEGAMVSFDDGAENVPLKSCVVRIEPVQEGTGDPSPDNVRPIKGWTGCTLTVSPDPESEEGTVHSIPFPAEAGKVYGGTLDTAKGVLTLDRYGYVYDGSEIFYKSNTAKNAFFNFLSDTRCPAKWPQMRVKADSFCNIFETVASAPYYKIHYGTLFVDTGHNFSCDPAVFGTTVESFQQKLSELYEAGTPLTVVSQLAQPLVFSLTAQEITTLLGANTIWADCGDVSVEYRADPTILYNKIMDALQG